jgi:hypothetical protein
VLSTGDYYKPHKLLYHLLGEGCPFEKILNEFHRQQSFVVFAILYNLTLVNRNKIVNENDKEARGQNG